MVLLDAVTRGNANAGLGAAHWQDGYRWQFEPEVGRPADEMPLGVTPDTAASSLGVVLRELGAF